MDRRTAEVAILPQPQKQGGPPDGKGVAIRFEDRQVQGVFVTGRRQSPGEIEPMFAVIVLGLIKILVQKDPDLAPQRLREQNDAEGDAAEQGNGGKKGPLGRCPQVAHPFAGQPQADQVDADGGNHHRAVGESLRNLQSCRHSATDSREEHQRDADGHGQ